MWMCTLNFFFFLLFNCYMGKTFRHYRPDSLMEIQTLILTDIQGTLGKMKVTRGHSLVGQWLRLCAPNAGGLGSIPGQGTRSHMPQLRVYTPQLKIPQATTKDKDLACPN